MLSELVKTNGYSNFTLQHLQDFTFFHKGREHIFVRLIYNMMMFFCFGVFELYNFIK